ncbi:ATP synthase F0, B subunit [Coriobacterium glomerans PW2]|uniref:ATP synthase subunit b n=1 Tax=Coriobacterium glomerans (strain ATCC 49209 / DSM 20642 / JCM 10262 / PW2) TaxID=700015 RepID=F2NAC7_CORGP|nr:F0F1 ATP synthase subunit B [Coriobacterium glomerans]AEB06313.1 ATP synthase F0, B subunit [Coriobacterium glomerans PW2]
MKFMKRVMTVAVALSWFSCAMPASAWAEESSDKVDILIPKPAEFFASLFVFLVIWIALAKFAWPKILSMMEERGARIKASLDEAEKTKQKAIADRKTSDDLVVDARRQAADIVLEARRDAEAERARIQAQAHAEAQDIIAKAHANAEEERGALYASAADSIAELSVSVASKIVGRTLDEDGEQRRLIEHYIKEAGSLNAD